MSRVLFELGFHFALTNSAVASIEVARLGLHRWRPAAIGPIIETTPPLLLGGRQATQYAGTLGWPRNRRESRPHVRAESNPDLSGQRGPAGAGNPGPELHSFRHPSVVETLEWLFPQPKRLAGPVSAPADARDPQSRQRLPHAAVSSAVPTMVGRAPHNPLDGRLVHCGRRHRPRARTR